MKADQANGSSPHHLDGFQHVASNDDVPELARSVRISQETSRRDPSDRKGQPLDASPTLAAHHQTLVDDGNLDRTSTPNGSTHHAEYPPSRELSPDAPSPSYSRESTIEPADFIRPNGQPPTALAEEDEDVWEDEEDSILMDEHGNVIYEGPAYEDSASDFSDGADAEDLDQHRTSYREATQQYRKSRRALLLSGLSSFASSPSSDELGSASPVEEENASASPSASIYETRRHTIGHESYYQPHPAESVDTGDTGGRTDDLRYDYDSGSEIKNRASAVESSPHDSHDIKREASIISDDNPALPMDGESFQTPKGLELDIKPLNGATLGSNANGTAVQRHTRPSFAPRALTSPLSRASLLTPEQEGIRQRRSLRDLKPSPSISEKDLHEPSEAYMTPRISLTTLHEENKPTSPTTLESPLSPSDDFIKKGSSASPADAPNSSRQDSTPFSLWDYLKEEVLATDFDATQEMKWERVTNFISIPFWMEKIILFGFVVCLDSFLYTFTILPLRFGVAMWTWVGNSIRWMLGGQKRYLHSSHKCDILKMLLIVLSCVILSRITDASKMYHSVRGQDVVKLSVIFNVLEIADRLCCSFGQDLLDSLFSRSTLARRKNGKQPYLRPVGFFGLSLCYVLAHTLVLFYQLVTLNVAINSYDNALLTLLLSNQFVEIKSSVFKKFEKENVFQMTCADIVERFQLTLMLSAIGLRNLIELSGGSLEPSSSPLPASFTVFPSLSLLETVLTPVCIVLASECIVDWLKHAFITKFNHIRPAVYGRFMDVLCRDLVVGGPSTKENSRKHTFVDQSPIISRRLGFAALPLACLLVRLILQIIGMIGDTSHIDECIAPISPRETGWIGVVARKLGANDIDNDWVRAMDLFVRGSAWALTLIIAWAFLVAIKLLLGTNLVSFASHRYATMHERENEENLNARDRAPIGTNKDERSYDKSLGRFIDRADDDAIRIKLDGTHVLPESKDRDKAKDASQQKVKKENSLMEVSRYNMVRSRIW